MELRNAFLSEKEGQGATVEAFATQRLSQASMHMKLTMDSCETDDPNLQCHMLVFGGVKKSFVCHKVDLLGK